MDIYDAFIYNLHLTMGHEPTARFLQVDADDPSLCHLCHPERCDFRCRDTHLTRDQIGRRWPGAAVPR